MVLATPERFTALVTPPDDRSAPALWFAFQGAQILVMRDAQSASVPRPRRAIERSIPDSSYGFFRDPVAIAAAVGTRRGCGAHQCRPEASSGAISDASGRLSVSIYKTDQLVCKVPKRRPGTFGRRRDFGQRPAGIR